MKTYELKGRIIGKAYSLIDLYFDGGNIVDILANSTLKAYLVSNEGVIDGMLNTFSDHEGNIDAEKILGIYRDNIPEKGVNIDIRDFVKNGFIYSLLPDKALHITRDDISELFVENDGDKPSCGT